MTDRPNEPVDFAAYARRRNQHQPELDAVHQAWADALVSRGASFADPMGEATALSIADMLDRLVTGALAIRLGTHGRAPDPDNGLDLVGAQLVRDLLADLRSAVEAARKAGGN